VEEGREGGREKGSVEGRRSPAGTRNERERDAKVQNESASFQDRRGRKIRIKIKINPTRLREACPRWFPSRLADLD